ncbi:putative glycosyl transferase [Nostoc linckia NIES-25]|nr:putative glycosyl transferase [Nostoc linckia NIES-25]
MYFTEEPITIFTVPKAFKGHIGIIQKNAIKSWKLLSPQPQILLFGNEEGIDEISENLDVIHVPNIQLNEYGTPLLDGIFRQAHELAKGSILSYINTDIILFNNFLLAVKQLQTASFDRFVMTGQRTDVNITEPLNFDIPGWDSKLRNFVLKHGTLASIVCMDYFVFPKPLYAEIPSFAVGRGHWDHWMVYHARQLGMPIVDATDVVTAIHQNHNYTHLPGGRGVAYVKGDEAKQNAKLAGDVHMANGFVATLKLTPWGLKKRNSLSALFSFMVDMPRFAKLIKDISFNTKYNV